MKHRTIVLFFLIGIFTDSILLGKIVKKKVQRSELAAQRSVDRAELLVKQGFNKKKKEADIKNLVDKAALYFEKHDLAESCLEFTRQEKFIAGDTYLLVYDLQGRLLAHAEQPNLLFANRLDEKDSFGFSYVKEILKVAQSGGGWVTYSWRDAVKVTYVQLVKNGNESFVIGAGYYPQAKEDFAVSIVKGAVTLFNDLVIKENYPVTEPFSTMNYPRKSVGDLYVYALDFKGNVYAHSDEPNLAADTNMIDYQDSTGKYINRETIKALETNNAIWIEYFSKNAFKRTYIERVVDKQGNKYFIACGYYPEANQDQAEQLVERAVQYMEAHGKAAAINDFSSKKTNNFRYGDLYIIVYDLQGIVVAHGWNDTLIGENFVNKVDEDGQYYIKNLLQVAQKGGGWVNAKLHNSFQSTYAEMVELGLEKYVVSCSFYPISKPDTAILLLNSAVTSLKSGEFRDVLRSFTQVNGPFIRGDLKIFVIDLQGICYVWGDNYRLVWQDIYNWKDQKGNPFIQYIIEVTAQGPAKVAYTFNNEEAVAFVERCIIGDKTYIVGSSFYF